MKTIIEIKERIEDMKTRSAWERGVKEYALELLDSVVEGKYPEVNTWEKFKVQLLNGAQDWHEYSWGGCSLIYDCDIAERLCSPSELKRKHDGELPPNSNEEWLDVQARALGRAAGMIKSAAF